MRPLKRKDIVSKTAKDLNLPEEFVDDVVQAFYTHVQKMMSSLEHDAIFVQNLGTFVVIKKNLGTKIEKYEKFIQTLQESEELTVREYEAFCKASIILNNLYTVKGLIQNQLEKKQQVSEKRKEYEKERERGLERQTKNSRGN